MKRKLWFSMGFSVLVILAMACSAMAGTLLSYPKFFATDSSTGLPLVGGKLYTYIAGSTTTNKATYSDRACATANANPVVLNARGEATIYLTGLYNLILKDSDDTTIWSMDNVEGTPAGNYVFYPNSTETDHGATGDGSSLKDILTSIGSTKATVRFLHSGASTTTSYTLTTTYDASTYSNVKIEFEQGAILTVETGDTVTFYSPANIIASPTQQIFSGAGTVSFSKSWVVYPEWWGVDGTSDETEINKAFTSLSAGGVVELAASAYSIDGSITPTSNTTLKIDPWCTVTLAATSDCPMISISGKTKVLITGGGTFDGAKATQAGDTDDHCIYIATSSTYITIDDVTLTNSYDDTINSTGTANLTIRKSRITNSRNNGFLLTGDSKVIISENYFSGNVATTGTANIVVWTGCANVLIEGNSFYDTGEVAGQGHGIYTYMSEGIRIHDNYFEDMYGWGIEVNTQTAGTVVMISGNVFHECGNSTDETGGIWVGASSSAVIANNAITEAQYHGMYLYQSDRCTVSNNTILDTQTYGLRFLDATNTTIVGNSVGDTGGSPTTDETITVGTDGSGPLSLTAVGNVMAGGTLNYINHKDYGIEAAANYETLTNWKIGNTLDGLAGQVVTLSANYTLDPGYSGVYFLDPGGANRNIVCDSGFRQGTLVFIINAADAAETLYFDSAGINQAIAQNQRGIFGYNGTAWVKIYIGS